SRSATIPRRGFDSRVNVRERANPRYVCRSLAALSSAAMEPTVALHLAQPDFPPDTLEAALAGRDYGPITDLLNDDTISEVMVNGPNQVYIERKGQLTPVNVRFESDAELIRVIREIASFVGRRIDDESPMVDCRLPDGSRVNAIIPPLAIDGPSLTIRKSARDPYTVPDRIVIGECRSGEALDMLQAMNTGHDGSLTTIHANSPRDTLARLETLVLMSGVDLPQRAIREQIASAIHLIVQQSRLRDGSRR